MTRAEEPSRVVSSKIRALDGIRGLAVLMILISHCLTQPLWLAGAVPGSWQYLIWRSTRLFFSGVDFFFVLSGFLICKVVLENRDSTNLFRVFYLRRACRILPLYLVTVLSSFVASRLVPPGEVWTWLFANQHPLWSYLTLTQNFLMGLTGHPGGNALAVTWSLSVEEQFYIVLPFCIRFLPERVLPWLFTSAFPTAYLVRMHWHDDRSYTLAPSRADALLLGCLLAWLSLQPSAMEWLRRQGVGLHLLAGVMFGGLLYINQMPEYFGEAAHSWLAAFYGVVTLTALTQPASWLTRILEWRLLCFLGTISYGLYLLHRPIQAAVHAFARGAAPKINSAGDLLLIPLIAGLTLLAAVLSYYCFERYILFLGRRIQFQQ